MNSMTVPVAFVDNVNTVQTILAAVQALLNALPPESELSLRGNTVSGLSSLLFLCEEKLGMPE